MLGCSVRPVCAAREAAEADPRFSVRIARDEAAVQALGQAAEPTVNDRKQTSFPCLDPTELKVLRAELL